MNDELKTRLDNQGMVVYGAAIRYESAKEKLDKFDAERRLAAKADGVKRTEAEVDAIVTASEGRGPLLEAFAEAKAAYDAVKTGTQCLLAKVSLVCAETAAMSRIAQ